MEDDRIISKNIAQIKVPSENHFESATFSPNGKYLVTGSCDGFIEVWDYETCKLNKTLKYQNEDKFMMHDEAILCLAFDKQSELLASGCNGGVLKVWKISTGQCMRKIPAAHMKGITSVSFSKDSWQLLTSSYDTTVKIHGLKSGKMLKEFRGHNSYVNCAIYTFDNINILSCSSDGNVKVWDVRTNDCLYTIRPPSKSELADTKVNNILQFPDLIDNFLICNLSSALQICSLNGQIIKTITSEKNEKEKGDFITSLISPQGQYIYGVSENSDLYCYDRRTGSLESVTKLDDDEIIGIIHNPTRNILVSYSYKYHIF